jgi:uridine kinase
VFDWRADAPVTERARTAPDDAIVIVDGVFLLRPELRDCWDYSIFVWASEPERLARSKVRDLVPGGSIGEIERLFWARYAPAHRLYWRNESPQRLADAFIDNEHPSKPLIRYRHRQS